MSSKRIAVSFLAVALCSFSALAQTTSTPDPLWQKLMNGNKQYVAGKLTYDQLISDRKAVAGGQSPQVALLSCADSRVAPELLFDQSLGDLFIVRAAGNIADTYGIASLEYAVANNWPKLLVVLAHEECGAVKASMEQGNPGSPHLVALVNQIRGSFYGLDWDPKDKDAVKKATVANARA